MRRGGGGGQKGCDLVTPEKVRAAAGEAVGGGQGEFVRAAHEESAEDAAAGVPLLGLHARPSAGGAVARV